MKILNSIIFVLLLSCSFAQKSKEFVLSELKISECKGSCPTKTGVKSQFFDNGNLTLSFGILLNCCFGDTFIVLVYSDTLVFQPITKKEFKRIQEAKSMGILDGNYAMEHCTCDCFFEVDLKLTNLKIDPHFIIVDNQINDSIDGFMGLEEYSKLAKVQRRNNSELLNEMQFKELLNKSINSNEIVEAFNLLGNDSVIYPFKDRVEVDYRYDGVYFMFDVKRKLARITLSGNFKGELPNKIQFGINKNELKSFMGKPTKEDERIVLQNNGEDASEGIETLIVWYYSSEKLRLMFDSKDKLVEVAYLKTGFK